MNEFDQMPNAVEGIELPDVDLEQGDGGGKTGGGMNPAIFAVIVTVILAFQAVSSYMIVKKFFFSKPPSQPVAETKAPQDFGAVFELDGIIVNPSDAKGSRHLLVDIGLQSEDAKVIAELGEREPALRDNIITFLSAQRYDVLTDISLRDKIRDRIKQIADYNLSKGSVDKVYFIRYVIQ